MRGYANSVGPGRDDNALFFKMSGDLVRTEAVAVADADDGGSLAGFARADDVVGLGGEAGTELVGQGADVLLDTVKAAFGEEL